MREILFRGKRIDNGEWVEGHLIWCEDGRARIIPSHTDIFCYEMDESIIQTVAHRVIPETVGRYTGLTDKNGNKIFEGDVLATPVDYLGAVMDIVKYKNGSFWRINGARDKPYLKGAALSKVIGNIHDNPELLDGVENG